MPHTLEQLLAIARRYWRDDKRYDDADEFSPEHLRLQARWSEESARSEWWYAFADRLGRRLPGFSIGNHTATGDADILAREIEAYFGAELLPRELLETPVPLIANFKEPPHTTLLHVLFAHEPTALP